MSEAAEEVFEGLPIRSVSIENLINQRTAIISGLADLLARLHELFDLASAAHLDFPRIATESAYGRRVARLAGPLAEGYAEALETLRKEVDASAWRYLMDESGLRSFMDSKARAAWAEQLRKEDVPPLSWSTVRATFSSLYDARGEMFERGVIECFRRLSWNYKTNLPQKFGKRIVVTRVLQAGYENYHATNELDDLMRVLHMVDGKPEPDHRNGMQQQVRTARTEQREFPLVFENDYLHLRVFKNGNAHTTFRRPELVARLNQILAKHYPNALPAAR